MNQLRTLLALLTLSLGITMPSLAEPPNISTVATDLLDLSPERCLLKAEQTLEQSPMTLTTKGSDFVAGTWENYKAMILCRSTSADQMIVVFMVAGQGTEQVELIAARLADLFRN